MIDLYLHAEVHAVSGRVQPRRDHSECIEQKELNAGDLLLT